MTKEKQNGKEKECQNLFFLSDTKPAEDFWKTVQQFWQNCSPFIGMTQAAAGTRDNTEGAGPSFLSDPLKPFWDGFILFHKQWAEMQNKAAQPVNNEEMGEVFQYASKNVIDMYGDELRKLLNMPQLGLARFYQERANLAVEKFSKFQSAINEFIVVLLKPTGKAFQEMQNEVRRLNEQGEDILQDTKKYYQLWMKKMEEKYLALLRSPEYTESLGNTLAALKDYRVAREQWMMDLLQDVPVPTNKDMDGLYKELYELKKKIRKLEKKGERP